jgi:hypothetical protein
MEHSVEWELSGEAEVLGGNVLVPLCLPESPHKRTRGGD